MSISEPRPIVDWAKLFEPTCITLPAGPSLAECMGYYKPESRTFSAPDATHAISGPWAKPLK